MENVAHKDSKLSWRFQKFTFRDQSKKRKKENGTQYENKHGIFAFELQQKIMSGGSQALNNENQILFTTGCKQSLAIRFWLFLVYRDGVL